jgi:hypothetical protein
MIRVRVPQADEAGRLADALAERGAAVECDGDVVTSVWPASDADHPHLWGDRHFPELVFFLRSWAGANADRQLVVLEERALTA